MTETLNEILEFLSSDTFGTLKIVGLSYLGLLWLSIIIWVTRDSLSRSNSILFQAFSILLNIAIPLLGVLLYLIIRPGKTRMERYYQELELEMLELPEEDTKEVKNDYQDHWSFCPCCGKKCTKKTVKPIRKTTKKTTTK